MQIYLEGKRHLLPLRKVYVKLDKKCIKCGKRFKAVKDTAKYCSVNCRVLWYQASRGKKRVAEESRATAQVLYNLAIEALAEVKAIAASKSQISPIQPPQTFQQPDTPENTVAPKNALKSFEQWRAEKRECESEETWDRVKEGILAAPNLSPKQKDFLIKY